MSRRPDDVGGDADDTIFAVSSGAPPAGIAVVRASGPAAANVVRALAGALPEPRRATLRALRDSEGDLLDRALVLWFPGPGTATGEDLAELHLHGGRSVIAAVLAALGAIAGCRPATPGEFTRRAFANGRIDLAEAEGLADLLAAETELARRQALRMAEGGISRMAEAWRRRLLGLSARAEAQLQFGDDEGDVLPDPTLDADIAVLAREIEAAVKSPPAERLRDGFRVVIAGPPNAGKSTLINALAGREAAIVSAEAGTTRDLIEVPVVLDGLPVLLIDSAGLRDGEGEVERIGIARAHDAMTAADLVLWLGEVSDAPEGAIRVTARIDLPERRIVSDGGEVMVSALTGEGIAELRQQLFHSLSQLLPTGNDVLLNSRQQGLVVAAAEALRDVADAALPELKAEQLRLARMAIDRLTGRAHVEDMLDALFGQFCLGK